MHLFNRCLLHLEGTVARSKGRQGRSTHPIHPVPTCDINSEPGALCAGPVAEIPPEAVLPHCITMLHVRLALRVGL